MWLALCLPLVLPLIAAIAARPLAERLPPKAASWLLAGGAVVLALASTAALGLLALTAVIRIPLVDDAEQMSAPVVSRIDPASLPIALTAAVLLAGALVSAGLAAWRRGEALVAACREAHRLPGRRQIVVLDEELADAYTLPGWPCRIVVTSGMLDALAPAERRVLLAHERAHARGLHCLFTTAARIAAAANPLLRPVTTALNYTVERWADEDAAVITGDRTLAARALARAALASAAPADDVRHAGQPPASRAGLAAAMHAIPRAAGPVPRRMAALLRPAPAPRLLLASIAILLVALAGASTLVAAHDMHDLLEYAQSAWGA